MHVLHEGSIWSVLTVGLSWSTRWGVGEDLRAPGRRSQRHTYWPSWPCGHKDYLSISIMVSMYCMNAAVTHLLEPGKSSNIFAWGKVLRKKLPLNTYHTHFRVRHVQVIATALSDGPIYFFLSRYLHFSSLCRGLLLWFCRVFPFSLYLPFIYANTQRQRLFIYSQTRWYQAHS